MNTKAGGSAFWKVSDVTCQRLERKGGGKGERGQAQQQGRGGKGKGKGERGERCGG